MSAKHFFSKTCAPEVVARVDVLMRDLREAIVIAADQAARFETTMLDDDGRSVQHAIIVADPTEQRSRILLDTLISEGKVPSNIAAASIGVTLVIDLTTARGLVEFSMTSGSDALQQFDDLAILSRAMRGMVILVFTCNTTLMACLPRVGVDQARA